MKEQAFLREAVSFEAFGVVGLFRQGYAVRALNKREIGNMYYVYIIRSVKHGSFYVGSTSNLKERLRDHNQRTVKTTKVGVPYILVWYCGFVNRLKALDFEKYLKNGSGFAFRNKHLI